MTSSYKWRHRSETILLTGPSRQFVGIFHFSQIFLAPQVHRHIPDIPEMDIPEIENEIEVEWFFFFFFFGGGGGGGGGGLSARSIISWKRV